MKFDIQILETVFSIVLKFNNQTPSVEEAIMIPVTILKSHALCLFTGLRNINYNYYITIIINNN